MIQKNELSLNVNPQEYYLSLTRGDKTKFLDYLMVVYGINKSTLSQKLQRSSTGELKKLESIIINNVIITEEWRR